MGAVEEYIWVHSIMAIQHMSLHRASIDWCYPLQVAKWIKSKAALTHSHFTHPLSSTQPLPHHSFPHSTTIHLSVTHPPLTTLTHSLLTLSLPPSLTGLPFPVAGSTRTQTCYNSPPTTTCTCMWSGAVLAIPLKAGIVDTHRVLTLSPL